MLGLRKRDNGVERIRPEVKDVRDEFLNIYRRTLDNEKDWAKRFTEERSPQTQKDLSVIESIENKKDNLLKVLHDKLNVIDSINKGVVSVSGKSVKSREVAEDFGKSFDIIKPYNEIIRNYLNPEINSKTREEIKTKLQEIVPLINQLIYITNDTFNNEFFQPPYTAQSYITGKRFLIPMITTYLALLVIQKNLFRGTYSTIDKPQLDIQYQEWYSSLNDINRAFLNTIKTPTGSNEAQVRREQLMEEDRGYPLSEDERLKLHNSIFGITSKRIYTPDELALLEQEAKRDAEFSERRQEEIEGRSREAQLRAMAGEQPVEITPEMPLPEPVGSLEPQDVSLMKRQQTIESIQQEVQDFLDKQVEGFNDLMKIIQPTKNLLGSNAIQKKRITNVIKKIAEVYDKGYQLINRTPPSIAEKQALFDNVINDLQDRDGNFNLTEAYLTAGNPRGTPEKRTDTYDNLLDAYGSMVGFLDNELETLLDRIQAGEATNLGRGKPRNKVSQAIHYNEAHNDPYLIR